MIENQYRREKAYQKLEKPLLEEAKPSWTKTGEKGGATEKMKGH